MILFSDIHGDLETLKKISAFNDDLKVFLGDLVTYGPDSRECVEFSEKCNDIIFLKGNWEAIITGETVSNRQFVTLNTCKHLIKTLFDFYAENSILEFIKKTPEFQSLKPFIEDPSRIKTLNEKNFINNLYYNRLEFLSFRLRLNFPNNHPLKWLDSLKLTNDLPFEGIATHGGLSNTNNMFTSTYHEFTATHDKALNQIKLAKKRYGKEKVFHAHTHFSTIIVDNVYINNVQWDYDYPLDKVSYASLPATGRFVRTSKIFPLGYLKINEAENSLKFIKL